MEKGLIVEKTELMFLLSCRGLKVCPAAFRPEKSNNPPETEGILKSMFQKGWLENDGSFFRVKEPLAGAAGRIAEAERVFCFCHGNPERELLFLYPGDPVLAVQESFRRKNALRMTYFEKKDLTRFLEEQGMTGEDGDWEPRPCPEGTEELLPERVETRGALKAYPWIRLFISVSEGQTGKELGRLAVIRTGIYDLAAAETGLDTGEESEMVECFSAGRLAGIILRWMEEGEG